MKSSDSFQKELNKGWLAAAVDNIYINGKLEKNVFCHAKLIHKINNDMNILFEYRRKHFFRHDTTRNHKYI